MDLFSELPDKEQNILPKDGIVNYYGQVFNRTDADLYFQKLMEEISWENDQAVVFGKLIVTKRKVAWYGDRHFSYTYSNVTKTAKPWTAALLELKQKCEEITGETYNSCLLNLYHDGNEGMAWHSDSEKDLKKNGAIASLSFGAERKFAFKHKVERTVIGLPLAHGSLLVMKGETQNHWVHRLPPTKRVNTARVNLTFRTIIT
jgi:alkylated DNA repair dioxygenase AlkB